MWQTRNGGAEDVAELALQLASRRVPVEDAVANIKAFADGLEPDEKAMGLTEPSPASSLRSTRSATRS